MQVWNQDYRIGGQVRENVIYSLKIIRLYYMCNRYSLFFFWVGGMGHRHLCILQKIGLECSLDHFKAPKFQHSTIAAFMFLVLWA